MTVNFFQMFVSSLLGGILGILFLIPFRKYFVNDKHGEYPFPKQQPVLKYLSRVKKAAVRQNHFYLPG